MKALSVEQIREYENGLILRQGFAVEFLMENAGKAVVECFCKNVMRREPAFKKRVCLFAGKGNNGGDAFAAAYFLKQREYEPYVFLFGAPEELKGAALFWFNKIRSEGVFIKSYVQADVFVEDFQKFFYRTDFFIGAIDGLLGIGTKGAPKGIILEAIKMLNKLGNYVPVFAIDVPSGIDCDTGEVFGEAVFADYTITMGYPKIGLLQEGAIENVGRLEVADIVESPHQSQVFLFSNENELELITKEEVLRAFPRRRRPSHNATYGELLIFAGSQKYHGAVRLAALAASYSGAGLVRVAVPQAIYGVAAAGTPQCIYCGVGDGSTKVLEEEAFDCFFDKHKDFAKVGAILIGPGLDITPQTKKLVFKVVKNSHLPLIIDADAITILAEDLNVLKESPAPSIMLTPHPGEMARLLRIAAADVQADRIKSVRSVLKLLPEKTIVILKGSGTLVAQKGKPFFINLVGNPGMAKGGSGDVLAGLLSGFVAAGIEPFDAALAAIYIHSKAGDMAASNYSENGFSMLHLADSIPKVLAEILLR